MLRSHTLRHFSPASAAVLLTSLRRFTRLPLRLRVPALERSDWRTLVAGSIGLTVLLLVVAWSVTWHRLAAEQALVRASARVQQQNLVTMVSENLGQVLDRGRIMAIAAEAWFAGDRHDALNRLSAMAAADRAFLRIALYDPGLRRVYTSSPAADHAPLRDALRDMLAAAALDPTHAPVFAPRPAGWEQAWQVPILFAVEGSDGGGGDGRVRGVLLVVLDLGYFLGLYQHIDIGRSGVLQILARDGTVIAEARQAGLVLDHGQRPALRLPATEPGEGSVSGTPFDDGRSYLSSFRQSERLPFTVVLSRDLDEILAGQQLTRTRALLALGVMSVLLLLATAWVVRSIRQQGRLFAALEAADRDKRVLIEQLEDEKRRAVVLAAHDPLTGLPNRRMFGEIGVTHLAQAKRSRKHYALLYLDLDRFKGINDTLGHHVGDLLLQTVAARLRAMLRDSDLIARLGGDEFAVLLTRLDSIDDAAAIAAKIVDHLSQPYTGLDGHEVQTSPSIGIAVFPRDGRDMDTLSRHADAAMYHAKRSGRGRHAFYDASLDPGSSGRTFSLEQRLPRAITDNELVLHFQPKVRLSDFRIVGFEALVRWQHPEFGLIPPHDFIPLAERAGFIVQLGDWVIRACCRQLVEWTSRGLAPVPIAFNASARQLQDETLPQRIADLLVTHGVAASLLEVEITESSLVESVEVAGKVLGALEKLGLGIALDDFGSGFSSLGYVRSFPIHSIKIDREFINDIRNSPGDAVIVTSIITLAHNLGMRVVAEGVELVDQLIHLKTAGCDEVQGYFFSRPVAPDAAAALLHHPFLSPS